VAQTRIWIPGYLNEHPVHNSLSSLSHHFVGPAAEMSHIKILEEKGPRRISCEPCPPKNSILELEDYIDDVGYMGTASFIGN